jgi:hypothetical protein
MTHTYKLMLYHLKDKSSIAECLQKTLSIMHATERAATRFQQICETAALGASEVVGELQDRPSAIFAIVHAVSTAKAKRCRPLVFIYTTYSCVHVYLYVTFLGHAEEDDGAG